ELLIFRGGRLETLRGLGKRDRRRQLELHQGGDHDRTSKHRLLRLRRGAASWCFASIACTNIRRSYGLAWSMNFLGGASPHCEVSASSAGTRFDPFARLSRSLS